LNNFQKIITNFVRLRCENSDIEPSILTEIVFAFIKITWFKTRPIRLKRWICLIKLGIYELCLMLKTTNRMNNTIKCIFLTFLVMVSMISCRHKTVTIPVDFIETTPPKYGSEEWYSLNYSKNEFSVNSNNGQLEINKVGKVINKVHECELRLPNGILTGIDKGEWGGSLTFNSTDSTIKPVEIKSGNIKFIFKFKDNIYFIEGLAHMSFREGALYELETTNDSFIYKKLLDFVDAPEAFTIYRDKFLIATHENFYVVKDFKKELVFKDTFWRSLYPNSIAVIDDKSVFLGIRSGIVMLDLTTKTMKFYKYDK